MPSSYTTSLRLTLPATGELSGQWGNTVNTGITELLDAAVAGTASISTWGGAGVAYTLSNNSGTADEARKMFIVATGSPGEAKNVICPAVSKFYVFRNDTTGGFALTLKTSGGTGIAVPAGQYKFLYCDGTNVVEMFNSVGALTLGTALAASSGGTGQSTYTAGDLIYATGATALAKLGIGASTTVLTSSGTAPQWTAASSVAIGTATNLAGGAAGSVPYQSGAATTTFLSIGAANTVMTSSGTAPQWSTALTGLTGVSTTTATLSGNLTLSGGTANGVLYLNGSKVATSGTAMIFDGTNLGIGISPAGKLDVYATGTTVGYVRTANQTLKLTADDSGNRVDLANVAGNPMSFTIGVTEGMRLTSTGLGIGTSSPVAKLDVNGSQSFGSASYQIGYALNSSTGTIAGANSPFYGLNMATFTGFSGQGIGLHGYYGLLFSTTGTERMRIDSSGNLGLGVTPSAWRSGDRALDIGSTASLVDAQSANTRLYNNTFVAAGGTNTYKITAAASYYDQGGGVHRWFNAASGTAGTAISFTQAMTLDASGNLGLGVTPSYKLDMHGASGLGIQIYETSTGNANRLQITQSAGLAIYNTTYGNGSTNAHVWQIAAIEHMRLNSSGNLGIGTSSPASKLEVYNSAVNAAFVASNPASWRVAQVRNDGTANANNAAGIAFVGRTDVNPAGIVAINSTTSGGVTSLAFLPVSGNTPFEAMRLDASGNLGLGVTPSAWNSTSKAIQIKDFVSISQQANGAANFGFNFYEDAANTFKYSVTDEACRFSALTTGGFGWFTAPSGTAGNAISFTQAMTLDADGELGVGITSPTARLHAYSATAMKQLTVDGTGAIKTGVNFANGGTTYGQIYFDNNAPYDMSVVQQYTTGSLIFGTNSTERARITSGGYSKFSNDGTYLNGSGANHEMRQSTNDIITYFSNKNATNPYGIEVDYTALDPNGTGNSFFAAYGTATLRANIRSNGGLANYSANDVNLSDRREKTNFAPAKSYLDTICAIPVQTFEYIDQSEDDPGLTLGVVAQDVQAVAPELVMESNWGTEDNPKMRLSIYQTDLQYALMKCIQEQQALITALTARVAALEKP